MFHSCVFSAFITYGTSAWICRLLSSSHYHWCYFSFSKFLTASCIFSIRHPTCLWWPRTPLPFLFSLLQSSPLRCCYRHRGCNWTLRLHGLPDLLLEPTLLAISGRTQHLVSGSPPYWNTFAEVVHTRHSEVTGGHQINRWRYADDCLSMYQRRRCYFLIRTRVI